MVSRMGDEGRRARTTQFMGTAPFAEPAQPDASPASDRADDDTTTERTTPSRRATTQLTAHADSAFTSSQGTHADAAASMRAATVVGLRSQHAPQIPETARQRRSDTMPLDMGAFAKESPGAPRAGAATTTATPMRTLTRGRTGHWVGAGIIACAVAITVVAMRPRAAAPAEHETQPLVAASSTAPATTVVELAPPAPQVVSSQPVATEDAGADARAVADEPGERRHGHDRAHGSRARDARSNDAVPCGELDPRTGLIHICFPNGARGATR